MYVRFFHLRKFNPTRAIDLLTLQHAANAFVSRF